MFFNHLINFVVYWIVSFNFTCYFISVQSIQVNLPLWLLQFINFFLQLALPYHFKLYQVFQGTLFVVRHSFKVFQVSTG